MLKFAGRLAAPAAGLLALAYAGSALAETKAPVDVFKNVCLPYLRGEAQAAILAQAKSAGLEVVEVKDKVTFFESDWGGAWIDGETPRACEVDIETYPFDEIAPKVQAWVDSQKGFAKKADLRDGDDRAQTWVRADLLVTVAVEDGLVSILAMADPAKK